MRDPARIDPLIERLRAVMKRHPDIRLGQLVYNGARHGLGQPAFVPEDDVLIAAIEEVYK